MKAKKKTPADYPIFSFRCSKDDKEQISKSLEQLHRKFNAEASADSYKINRNDLLLTAIKRGMASLQKLKRFSEED